LIFWFAKTSSPPPKLRATPELALGNGQIRVRIDKFALTTNNITYAAFGEAMNYWAFFPVDGPEHEAWGRIPVWGFATVVQSMHPDLAVGEKLYGYYPMSSSVVLQPTRVSAAGFSDAAAHRASLHPVYNQYVHCSADPFYTADSEDTQDG
jgi:hypothetical protein